MSDTALDFSFTHPSAQEIKNSGAVGILVYTGPARPTLQEVQSYLGAGLSIAWVYETGATWAFGGYDVGVGAAKSADLLLAQYGWPLDRPVYYAVDTNNIAGHEGAIEACFNGICDTTTRPSVGVYGSRETIDIAQRNPKVTYAWKVQTWGDNNRPFNLMQMPNVAPPFSGVDVNQVLADDWGQHPYGTPLPEYERQPMAVVGHHWPDGHQPGPNDDWYGIDGGMLVHQFGGPLNQYNIPSEAQEWLNKNCPIAPLSDGDLTMLKARSGWK